MKNKTERNHPVVVFEVEPTSKQLSTSELIQKVEELTKIINNQNVMEERLKRAEDKLKAHESKLESFVLTQVFE